MKWLAYLILFALPAILFAGTGEQQSEEVQLLDSGTKLGGTVDVVTEANVSVDFKIKQVRNIEEYTGGKTGSDRSVQVACCSGELIIGGYCGSNWSGSNDPKVASHGWAIEQQFMYESSRPENHGGVYQ